VETVGGGKRIWTPRELSARTDQRFKTERSGPSSEFYCKSWAVPGFVPDPSFLPIR